MTMMMTTPPHRPTMFHRRRSLLRTNPPGDPASTTVTPLTQRMTPLKMTLTRTPPMMAAMTGATETMAATTTFTINSPMTPSIS
jgi:hypothetical protein